MKICPRSVQASQGDRNLCGFTLIELLLVVFILSTLALTGLALTETADSQLRFEDTRVRLQRLKRAIIGDTEPVFQGQRLLSGFVADTGILPDDLRSLSEAAGVSAFFGEKVPIFDPRQEVTNGLNDGLVFAGEVKLQNDEGRVPLDGREEVLFKGFRGPYLNVGSGTHLFRDGWGNVNSMEGYDDYHNYGWHFETLESDPGCRITSKGSDGELDSDSEPVDLYGKDTVIEIARRDWQIDLGSLSVSLANETEEVISATGLEPGLRLCALVYVQGLPFQAGAAPRWRRVNGDLFSGTIPSGGEVTLTFPVNSWVPIGRHLVLLIKDRDEINNSGDETPFESSISGERIRTRVSLYPRTHPQDLRLTIR